MRRLHLLEIHEQSWCPRVIRDAATGFLGFVATVGGQYDGVTPKLREAIDATGAERVVDLCSGSGGPWVRLEAALNRGRRQPLTILLTDLFPRQDAHRIANQRIRYVDRPVDATRLPDDLAGFRTLFTSFHHFQPHPARAIFEDAVRHRQGIAVFEQTARTVPAVVLMLVLAPLVWVTAPFVRPFRWAHFFWTCVVPVVPLVLVFDGVVSCLRTYTPSELQQMIASLDDTTGRVPYVWEVGRLPAPLSGVGVHYAIGYPKPDAPAA